MTGLLSRAEAEQNMRRIAPLLLFLGSVIVLAQLVAGARVFDLIATRLAIIGTPWASLATLLGLEPCRVRGVHVGKRGLIHIGLGLAAFGTAASIMALLLTG